MEDIEFWGRKGSCRWGLGLLNTEVTALSTSSALQILQTLTLSWLLCSLQDAGECCFLRDPGWSLLPSAVVAVLVWMALWKGGWERGRAQQMLNLDENRWREGLKMQMS